MVVPRKPSLYHLRFITGDNPLLTLDDDFLRKHTKVLLTSDASDKIWEVKLDGNRLAGGWEEFAAVHNFSDGDVLVFRHNGDEIFHVAVTSESDDESDDTDDSESDDESDDVEDEDNGDEDVDDPGDILVEKNKKHEAETSTGLLRPHVTRYSLKKDRLDLSRDFKFMTFDEQNKPCEIYLANEKGRKWTLILSRNISSGAFYIRRGWANFCSANGLSPGDICNFKLSQSGERPVLLLRSHESGNGHEEEQQQEECSEADAEKICSVGGSSKEKNTPRFLTLKYTPNRFKTGQLTISSVFLSESGINMPGEITFLNKDGRKWPSYLQVSGQRGRELFYMRKGWREMCKANGVEVNDSFVLELLICEDANPIFKFHSKIENKGEGNIITRKKRALHLSTVENTPEMSKRGRTRVSNRSNTNLQHKQPESCSVSDQVANVKQSILDTLNSIRHFRAELKTREKNLEASLLEVDDLGERILGISKILNNNLV